MATAVLRRLKGRRSNAKAAELASPQSPDEHHEPEIRWSKDIARGTVPTNGRTHGRRKLCTLLPLLLQRPFRFVLSRVRVGFWA